MALAQNIRYLRKKRGWGQDELAEKLGYKSYTTIQKWESGVSEPPLKVVHELATVFCVDINDLTNGDLENKKAPTGNGEINGNSPTEPKLSEGEEMLLNLFRQVPADQKELVLQMIRAALGKM